MPPLFRVTAIMVTAALVAICSPTISLAEQVLCMRKNLRANNQGRVNFRKAYTVRDDACLKREVQVLTIRESADILSALSGVDGTNSGLDADLLDGMDSSSFGSASDVSQNQTNISTNTGNISSNTSSITTVSTDLNTAEADIRGLSVGDKLVRVGTENAEYTTLADAISFVNSQTRDATNRWVILIGPGTHTLASRIDVPSFTTIRGFGKTSTIISASISGSTVDSGSAAIAMGTTTALEDLQVVNAGNGVDDNTFGIFAPDVETASELDETNFRVRLDRVIVRVRSASTRAYPVLNAGSHLLIRESELSAGNSVLLSVALANNTNNFAQTTVINSTLYAKDDDTGCAAECRAITNLSAGELRVINSSLEASTIGIRQLANGDVIVRSSEIDSKGQGITLAGSSDLYISNSTLQGGVTDSTTGTISCSFTADLNGSALAADCT